MSRGGLGAVRFDMVGCVSVTVRLGGRGSVGSLKARLGKLWQGGLGLFQYGRIWLGMMGRGGQGGVGFDVLRRGEAVAARPVKVRWVKARFG